MHKWLGQFECDFCKFKVLVCLVLVMGHLPSSHLISNMFEDQRKETSPVNIQKSKVSQNSHKGAEIIYLISRSIPFGV